MTIFVEIMISNADITGDWAILEIGYRAIIVSSLIVEVTKVQQKCCGLLCTLLGGQRQVSVVPAAPQKMHRHSLPRTSDRLVPVLITKPMDLPAILQRKGNFCVYLD